MITGRPAGFSSDKEYSDGDLDFGFELPRRKARDANVNNIPDIPRRIAEIAYVKNNKPEKNVPVKMLSYYQSMLKELPDTLNKGRLYGFPNEVLRIIHGIELQHLTPLFKENEVQLTEFLTWGDEDWKKFGVSLSLDRQKIKVKVRKFHEHEWGKQSIKVIEAKEQIDFFEFVQISSNMLRQVHVMRASTLYYLKNGESGQLNEYLNVICEKSIVHAHYIKKELKPILEFANHMEKTQKIDISDLIEPKKTSWKKIILVLSLIGVCACKHKTILNLFAGALSDISSLKTKFIK